MYLKVSMKERKSFIIGFENWQYTWYIYIYTIIAIIYQIQTALEYPKLKSVHIKNKKLFQRFHHSKSENKQAFI